MVHKDFLDKVRVVRGDVCDQEVMERTLGEYEISTVVHVAAQTISSASRTEIWTRASRP